MAGPPSQSKGSLTHTHFGIDAQLSRVESTRSCSGAEGSYPRADAKSHGGQPRNRGSEGIEEKPVEIEPMAFAGLVRPIHAVRIELTGTDPRHPDVPDVPGTVARGIQIDDPGRLCVFGMVEQLQSNAAARDG